MHQTTEQDAPPEMSRAVARVSELQQSTGDAGAAGSRSYDCEVAPSVEGYQILGRLGEGGMGTVWRALQLSTRRPVALKLMGLSLFGSDTARSRFDREVKLTA